MKVIRIFGANRGGKAGTRAFLETSRRVSPLPDLLVQIVDIGSERASALASTWSQAGHAATSFTVDARNLLLNDQIDILNACTDDPALQLHLLQNKSAKLTIAGLIAAAPVSHTGNGFVLGFGVAFQDDEVFTRAAAETLFQSLVALSGGERVSSRALRAPVLNDAQIEPVRIMLYRKLAAESRRFLESRAADTGLYLACLWPQRGIYPVILKPREGLSRAAMRDSVVASYSRSKVQVPVFRPNAPLSSSAAENRRHAATVFFDPQRRDWLYVVLPSALTAPVAIELPNPPTPVIDREIRLLEEEELYSAQQEEHRQTVYMTD